MRTKQVAMGVGLAVLSLAAGAAAGGFLVVACSPPPNGLRLLAQCYWYDRSAPELDQCGAVEPQIRATAEFMALLRDADDWNDDQEELTSRCTAVGLSQCDQETLKRMATLVGGE